jgi:hypothetical protein
MQLVEGNLDSSDECQANPDAVSLRLVGRGR